MTEFLMKRRQFVAGMGAMAGTSLLPNLAHAAFPDSKINITVPTRAGGGADRDVRIFTSVWQKHLKTDFEYRFFPGAAGRVGYEIYVGKRKPDAYSLLFANLGPEVIMQELQQPKARLGRDFIYFFLISSEVMSLFVGKRSKFTTAEELVAEAKKRTVTIAVSRIPHPASLGCLALAEATGAKFKLIPYGGGNPSAMAAITGETDACALPFAQPIRLGSQARILLTFGPNQAPEMSGNAPAVNDVFATKIPDLNSARGFGIHTKAVEEFPDRFEILKTTMAKAAADPAYAQAVKKAGLPLAFIDVRGQKAAMENARQTLELAARYKSLLTGK